MNGLSATIQSELLLLGADIVGFGDLRGLSPDVRNALPVGICVAARYPPDVIRGIAELPTREYCDWYHKLNERLDSIVTQGAEFIRSLGFDALAQTRERVGFGETGNSTVLPHKTVATRAGIGWIGKSALLVNEIHGSMIRLSAILTDAPVKTAVPINESKCGGCNACTNACPAEAVSGKLWNAGMYRDEFFDPAKCRKTASERARQGFGGEITICGKCIEICPYTRRALKDPR
jgi:epoxyqueuosine reductase QueG